MNRLTIADIDRILADGSNPTLEILSDGSVIVERDKTNANLTEVKIDDHSHDPCRETAKWFG